jgi:indolepyruvate ferredoxin oxidoreductase, beta subunit
MNRADILVAGVGGQGTLLASNILAEVGMIVGYDVKKSDVLGLAVRGGSVLSHVRWGEDIASPVSMLGSMGYMLAFEPLEALRGIKLLRRDALALCNLQPIMPISVSSGDQTYPERASIERMLTAATGEVRFVDATRTAMDLGNPRVTNVIMLGAFSTFFDIESGIWVEAVLGGVPEMHRDLNRAAFHAGREMLGKG